MINGMIPRVSSTPLMGVWLQDSAGGTEVSIPSFSFLRGKVKFPQRSSQFPH